MNIKKKIYFSLALSIVLNLSIIFFLIYPNFLGLKKDSENFLWRQQELFLLDEREMNVNKFKNFYNKEKVNLNEIERSFINPDLPVDFIGFLEKISQDSQLLIKISPIPAAKTADDPWNSIGFQLELDGSFPDFLKFLEKLESNVYLIEIKNLNIQNLTESAASGNVKANIVLKVYTRQ